MASGKGELVPKRNESWRKEEYEMSFICRELGIKVPAFLESSQSNNTGLADQVTLEITAVDVIGSSPQTLHSGQLVSSPETILYHRGRDAMILLSGQTRLRRFFHPTCFALTPTLCPPREKPSLALEPRPL